jgi:hypothetical protein
MFSCQRCGSTFSPAQARGLESCPGCLTRDAVSAPLTFHIFSIDTVPKRRHAVDQCRRASKALEGFPAQPGSRQMPTRSASRLGA